MSKFASGKYAYGISDRSGFRYRLRDMRKEWNGLLVGKDEWEEKHPQLTPLRKRPDPIAIKNARPEPNLVAERSVQYGFNPVGYNDYNNFVPNNLVGSRAATLNLSEGSTYRFDQSDSSNSNHPLRFSTTSNGTHGGGSEYTTGVTTNGTPGSSGAYSQIEVASGAPTLYYYCTNHSGMGGTINT